MGDNLPPLSCSPHKTSEELTINTSLWTANRNRIHTMHIFINSCPNSLLNMNRSSLVTVHVRVGDLRYVTVLWCSHHRRGQIIIAQEGTNSTRLRELALVQTWSTVGCHCWVWRKSSIRADSPNYKSWRSLRWRERLLKIILDEPFSLSLRPNISSPGTLPVHW